MMDLNIELLIIRLLKRRADLIDRAETLWLAKIFCRNCKSFIKIKNLIYSVLQTLRWISFKSEHLSALGLVIGINFMSTLSCFHEGAKRYSRWTEKTIWLAVQGFISWAGLLLWRKLCMFIIGVFWGSSRSIAFGNNFVHSMSNWPVSPNTWR